MLDLSASPFRRLCVRGHAPAGVKRPLPDGPACDAPAGPGGCAARLTWLDAVDSDGDFVTLDLIDPARCEPPPARTPLPSIAPADMAGVVTALLAGGWRPVFIAEALLAPADTVGAYLNIFEGLRGEAGGVAVRLDTAVLRVTLNGERAAHVRWTRDRAGRWPAGRPGACEIAVSLDAPEGANLAALLDEADVVLRGVCPSLRPGRRPAPE